MQGQGLDDGVVRLRERADDDAAWYAGSVRDPLVQRFTTITVGALPAGIAADPKTDTIYVTNVGGNTVSVLAPCPE